MLRPLPMVRALAVGPRDRMEETIEALYGLKLLHIVDHHEGEDELGIGRPLPQAPLASEILVKLRSIASVLQIDEKAERAKEAAGEDLREKILSLELNISEEDAAKKKTQALLADLTRRIDEMTPFARLPLRLEDYRGFESLDVVVGRVPREVAGLETVTRRYEAFEAPGFLAVFVAKEDGPAMREHLSQQGLASVAVPEGEGDPKALLAELVTEKGRWEQRLAEVEDRLVKLRGRYAGFLVAAKTHLEIQVEKAEAPLRFAATDHSFVVEGWVPQERFPALRDALGKIPGVFIDELETDAHAASPPILLRNAKPFRPFEMLVKLFAIPSYHEIDPTFVVAIVFPVFFGIMIGDAGYGLAWFFFGLYLLRKKVTQPGQFRDLVITVTWGGFFATLFGFFMFAEAFGIPFHAVEGEATGAAALDWTHILGIGIPFHAYIEKLHQVPDFIVLAIVASFLHLGSGYVIGFFNEVRHSKKHALGKISWILILVGLFVVLIVRASGTRVGRAVWEGPLGWFPRDGLAMANLGFGAANPIPWAAVYLLVAGIVLLLATEGGLHLMEVFSLVANMISYARLAAVGVAKAAMALAFNIIALDSAVLPGIRDGNIGMILVGLFIAGLFHMIVFLLGAVSAYIQSLRLNYVEYFLKFYEGAGQLFRPFGMRTETER